MTEFFTKNKSLSILLLFFGIAYALISLVNHYLFRTYALDLGLYNNALYDYAHFRFNEYSLQQEFCPNPLADHFDLTPIIFSPLYWIFGSYSLLIVQIVSILFGGFGVFYYFKSRTELKFLPEIAALHFFCLFAIYSAVSYDYHGNVVGAMFVPWFFHYFEIGNRKKYWLCLFFILISREHMALWAIFLAMGLLIGNFKDKQKRYAALLISFVSLVYFILVVNYIMPALDYQDSAKGGFRHFSRYGFFGNSPGEIISYALHHPFDTLYALFANHIGDPAFDGIKAEFHFMVMVSGGFAFIIYPRFFIMMIPIYAQKLLSDDAVKWGMNYHYSIEFAPIITIAIFTWFLKWKSQMTIFIISVLMVLVTIIATVTKFDRRKAIWYEPSRTKFYYSKHYQVSMDAGLLHQTLNSIPENAAVSATSAIVPHLSFRDKIYQFPVVMDADFIILFLGDTPYPLKQSEFDEKTNLLMHSPDWELIVEKNKTLVFRRK